MQGVWDTFNSQYNKIYWSDDYHSFLKQQNIAFACTSKPNTERRSKFEKRVQMNEKKNYWCL